MQDLVDTLRSMEDELENLHYPKILNASGKQFLGGATYVGITVELLDAQIAFEARPGPDWVLCSLSGGNLVAVDSGGNTLDPRYPSAYVTVDRTASASATMQQQDLLEYASFNGGVTVDVVNGHSGTEKTSDGKIIGTARAPSNNLVDAGTIAIDRGFTSGFVVGDATFDNDVDVEKFSFYGSSRDLTHVQVDDAAGINDCSFFNMHVTGYLDGNSHLNECKITDIDYIKGKMEQCLLEPGTIKIMSGGVAYLLDCWTGHTVTMDNLPTIDMNGSGQSAVIRNHNGAIKIINKTGTDTIVASLDGGSLFIDLTTVTNGFIIADGVGSIVNAATRDTLVTGSYGDLYILNKLISSDTVANGIWEHESGVQLLSDMTFIKDIEGGRWEISGTQMIFYADDNITEVARFDLTKTDGAVVERTRV